MNDQQNNITAEDKIDEPNEYSIRTMLGDFYNRKMTSIVVLVMLDSLIAIALAVYAAIRFFNSGQTRNQIMFATIFLTAVIIMALLKIVSWQIIHRNAMNRKLSKIENQIAQLNKTMTDLCDKQP